MIVCKAKNNNPCSCKSSACPLFMPSIFCAGDEVDTTRKWYTDPTISARAAVKIVKQRLEKHGPQSESACSPKCRQTCLQLPSWALSIWSHSQCLKLLHSLLSTILCRGIPFDGAGAADSVARGGGHGGGGGSDLCAAQSTQAAARRHQPGSLYLPFEGGQSSYIPAHQNRHFRAQTLPYVCFARLHVSSHTGHLARQPEPLNLR
jgi:hypothetical protein